MDRRKFLLSAASGVASVGLLNGSAIAADIDVAPNNAAPSTTSSRGLGGILRKFRLVAQQGEVEIGPDETFKTWLYNGQFPGPEIRVKEGDRLQITVKNELPEETTVHWHGVPVPNAMDGVPA